MSIAVKVHNGHLEGHLGEILFSQFLKLGWVRKLPGVEQYALTPKGERELGKLGIAATKLPLEEVVEPVYDPNRRGFYNKATATVGTGTAVVAVK